MLNDLAEAMKALDGKKLPCFRTGCVPIPLGLFELGVSLR